MQSALALSEGLSRISDSAKDFRRLGLVIQQTTVFQKGLAAANLATAAAQKALGVATVTTSTGFKVLRGAIIATGIGALAIAVIAVVQNFDKLKAALLNAVPGLKTIADGIGNIVQGVTDFLGITSEAERQTTKALEENAKAIRRTEKELELNGDKYDEFTQRKIKANLDYRKSFEELTKDEKLTEDERNRYIAQARAKANREIAAADVDRQAKADKAAEDGRKKVEEQAKAEKAARVAATKEANNELAKLRDEAALAAIADENERALKAIDQQLANERKRVQALTVSKQIKQALLSELEAKGERDRQAIRAKAAEEQAARKKEATEKAAKEQADAIERSRAIAASQIEEDRRLANERLSIEVDAQRKRIEASVADDKERAELLRQLDEQTTKQREAIRDEAARKAITSARELSAKLFEVERQRITELTDAANAEIRAKEERDIAAIDARIALQRREIDAAKGTEQEKQAIITALEAQGAQDRQKVRDGARAQEAAAIEALNAQLDETQTARVERDQVASAEALERLAQNKALELEIRKAGADSIEEQRLLELERINAEYDARVAKAAQTGEDIYLIEQLRAQKVDELNRQSAASEEALAKMKKQQRLDQLGAISQVAGDVAKIVGEQTALGKTLAIASAVIETALSAQRAYSSLVGIPVVGPVLAPIAAGAAIAAGIKNVRTIQNTKLPGVAGGAGGGGGVPSIAAPTATGAPAAPPIAPTANAQVVGQTLNRDAINQAGSAVTRAYVVESDISSSQERTRRIERAARLG